MKERLVAGLVGLLLVLPALIWGGLVGTSVVVALALLIGLDEYAGMAAPTRRGRARALLVVGGLAMHLAFAHFPDWTLPAVALAILLAMSWPMFAEPEVGEAAEQTVRLGFGMVYVPVLLAPLVRIRADADGLGLVFLLLAVTWLGDTGAYFAGRFAGRTPLFPRVSPKKTVEGVVGGAALSLVGALVVQAIAGTRLSWVEVVVLAVVLDLAGVVGDLAESMLKRAWGVKDSGWIMPGHGGILDRVDSLLFSGPLLWTWLFIRPMFLP